jgi:hypothetical protein
MDQQKNNISNKFSLNTILAIDMYNADSIHNVKILINNKIFHQQKLAKNKEYFLKIEDYFNYAGPGPSTLTIMWNGDHDCEHKYMKIRRIIINQQHLAPYKAMIEPIENDYIKNLKSSDHGVNVYRKYLLQPGYRHGWYGAYRFQFVIDPSSMTDRSQLDLMSASGIQNERILTDVKKAKYFNRANN